MQRGYILLLWQLPLAVGLVIGQNRPQCFTIPKNNRWKSMEHWGGVLHRKSLKYIN